MKDYKTIRIGVFVVLVVALSIWGFYFLKGSNIINKKNSYIVVYDDIEGLSVSSPVLIRGLKIGQVSDIHFSNDTYDSLIVELLVDNDIRIPRGTVARIYSSDLMGSKSIQLIVSDSLTFLAPGDRLHPDVEENLKEQVKLQMLPLKKKAESLMGSMDSVLAMVEYIFNENTKQNIRTSILSIRRTFENLEHSSRNIDSIVSNGNVTSIMQNIEGITRNVKKHNKEISNILENLSSFSDTLVRSQLSTTLQKTNLALVEVQSIANKINQGQGSLGMLLNNDTLYRNITNVSADLDSLLIDIKENPSRYINVSVFGSKKEKWKDTKKRN